VVNSLGIVGEQCWRTS